MMHKFSISDIDNIFQCDEINIPLLQFKEELNNQVYLFPDNIHDKWDLEKKIKYISFLKNGYPDVGIIIDVKTNGQRIILDGVERCSAIQSFSFILNKNEKKIRIFELRGANSKKIDFLRYYNFNGREKSESELRKLIYGEYLEYKILECINKIFTKISKDITMDFLLKILSRITIREILEEDQMIEMYLDKYMKTLTPKKQRFRINSFDIIKSPNNNIDILTKFLSNKLEVYACNKINYIGKKDVDLKKLINKLDGINLNNFSLVSEYKNIITTLKEITALLDKLIEFEKETINISCQFIERDFYKFVKLNIKEELWKK